MLSRAELLGYWAPPATFFTAVSNPWSVRRHLFANPPPLPSKTCTNETEKIMLDMTCRVASCTSITQVEVTEGVLASYCEYRRIESKLRFYQLLSFPNP